MEDYMIQKCWGILGIALIFSCASKPDAYKKIDAEVDKGSYEAAIAEIVKGQEEKKPRYDPEKNVISLSLDKGMLEHYAGKYDDSSKDLEEGQRLIEEAVTKSVTQDIASYIANDNTKEYAGEDYEDIYINIFNALNYYRQGNLEGAQVEARKTNEKLTFLPDKYAGGEGAIKEWVKTQLDSLIFPDNEPVAFTNSALANYLAAILLRGDDNPDTARINILNLNKAYAAAPSIYKNPVPQSLKITKLDTDTSAPEEEAAAAVDEEEVEIPEELQVPSGKARLNIIGFAGLSPIKEEARVPVSFPFFTYQDLQQGELLLPKLSPRGSGISRIEVAVDGAGTVNLELLEDMEAVMVETFKAKFSLTYLKTLVRTATKYLAANVAAVAAEKGAAEKNPSLGPRAGASAAKSGKASADASEGADIRMGRYFPGKAYVGGITLDPGTYSVTVNYYGNGGVIASYKQDNVKVEAGKPNLIEAICLK
jgi:hypothetical protein